MLHLSHSDLLEMFKSLGLSCLCRAVCAELLLLTTKLPGVSRFACKVNVDVLIKQKAHQQPELNVKNV